MRGRCLAVLLVGTLAAACGGSGSHSTRQLQAKATRICLHADRRVNRIGESPTHSELYLKRGLTALQRELAQLRTLHAPAGDAGAVYQSALSAFSNELSAVAQTIDALDHRADPVLAFRALEHRLVPLERRANAAWRKLGVSACAS